MSYALNRMAGYLAANALIALVFLGVTGAITAAQALPL